MQFKSKDATIDFFFPSRRRNKVEACANTSILAAFTQHRFRYQPLLPLLKCWGVYMGDTSRRASCLIQKYYIYQCVIECLVHIAGVCRNRRHRETHSQCILGAAAHISLVCPVFVRAPLGFGPVLQYQRSWSQMSHKSWLLLALSSF